MSFYPPAHPPGVSMSPRLAVRDSQWFSGPLQSETRVVILFCNLVGSGQQASRYVNLLPDLMGFSGIYRLALGTLLSLPSSLPPFLCPSVPPLSPSLSFFISCSPGWPSFHYVTKIGLELLTFLSRALQCWDFWGRPPHWVLYLDSI